MLVELRALRDEVRAKLNDHYRKLDSHSRITDARLNEVRPKMDAIEASVRAAQVGIADISERMNDVQEVNEGGKRCRLNSDYLLRSDAEQEERPSTPKANEFAQRDPATGKAVQVVEVEFGDDAMQGTSSGGDISKRMTMWVRTGNLRQVSRRRLHVGMSPQRRRKEERSAGSILALRIARTFGRKTFKRRQMRISLLTKWIWKVSNRRKRG